MPFESDHRGATLVETMIAILVAFIAMSGIGVAVFRATVSNKNEGTEQARLTALAQEKMEELLRLTIGDTTTNTTLVTDSGWQKGLTAGGGTDLLADCPGLGSVDIGYVDFLDQNSQPVQDSCAKAIATNYGYQRRWQITDITSVASAELLGYGDGTTKTFNHNLAVGSVTPGSVTINATIGGAPVTGTDDGSGKITGSQIVPGLSTINYTTGAISVTFTFGPDSDKPVNTVVTAGSTLALKQISVVVYSRNAVKAGQAIPKVVLTSLKSQ